jgi:hypothetical protein
VKGKEGGPRAILLNIRESIGGRTNGSFVLTSRYFVVGRDSTEFTAYVGTTIVRTSCTSSTPHGDAPSVCGNAIILDLSFFFDHHRTSDLYVFAISQGPATSGIALLEPWDRDPEWQGRDDRFRRLFEW